MTKKEWQRHMAYEALVILGMLALLLFVCRLWPILLLVILGIFAAALRLVFLSSPKVQPIQPEQQTACSRASAGRDKPGCCAECGRRPVLWRAANAGHSLGAAGIPRSPVGVEVSRRQSAVPAGRGVAILLNRAGGYREAVIHLQGKRLFEIQYLCAPAEKPQLEEPASPQEEQPTLEEAASQPEPSQPEDYSLAAFEWVESHLEELNTLCNECIAQKQDFLLLTGGDLPEPAAWPALCQELLRNGLSCHMEEEGVRIQIARENRRKE